MLNETMVGRKFLITTDCWFIAPDGHQYKSVYGTLKGIHNDQEALGIKTNRGSTNWYVEIGNMSVAGCQVHYSIQADKVNIHPTRNVNYDGTEDKQRDNLIPLIYNADEEYCL